MNTVDPRYSSLSQDEIDNIYNSARCDARQRMIGLMTLDTYITDRSYLPNIEILSLDKPNGTWIITSAINIDTDKLYTQSELDKLNSLFPELGNSFIRGDVL